jgi:transcriptional regulator of acetoin/glycerol metabolism
MGEDARGGEKRTYTKWSLTLTRETIERALAEAGGNISLAARALGMQRSQFYRAMEKLEVDPTNVRGPRE